MGRWVQRDAQTWWAIIQRQMESGLSQVAFCAAEGLSVSSLQNWKRTNPDSATRKLERAIQNYLSPISPILFNRLVCIKVPHEGFFSIRLLLE